MEQRENRAYRLIWETRYLDNCDEEYELELEEFSGSEWIPGLIETSSYEIPEPVIFWGNPEFLSYLDYPTSNVNWPIMTRRMLYTLLTIGGFPHRVIPVALMDGTRFTYEPERRFLTDGQPNPEITNFDDLVAVQILEYSDYFDFERSQYEPSPKYPDLARSVSSYVLAEPSEGFPPLFRLNASAATLFISAEAREALRETGIRGVAYYPLNSLQSEVDIPVQLPTCP
jgi:hypothetical protein